MARVFGRHMSADPGGWLSTTVGAAFALAGLALVAWALFRDRARGRRRCPGCWYDIAGVPADPVPDRHGQQVRTCPECGRRTPGERPLLRTRRQWRLAAAGVLVMWLGPYAWMTAPRIRSQGWLGAA